MKEKNVYGDGMFLCKDTIWSEMAFQIINIHQPNINWNKLNVTKDSNLKAMENKKWDFCISFLCPKVIPKSILMNSNLAVNFHPGDRAHPGIGCYNFALYNNAKLFGVCCHHMHPNVDTGPIIMEDRFEILETETVESLQYRSYIRLLALVDKFFMAYSKDKELRSDQINWIRKPYTRRELNALCLPFDQSIDLSDRLHQACYYPGFGPMDNTDDNLAMAERVFISSLDD